MQIVKLTLALWLGQCAQHSVHSLGTVQGAGFYNSLPGYGSHAGLGHGIFGTNPFSFLADYTTGGFSAGTYASDKTEPRTLTCANRVEMTNYKKKSLVFIAATVQEETKKSSQPGYGHVFGSFLHGSGHGFGPNKHHYGHIADPFPSSSSLTLDLQVHSYGEEGQANVVFTRQTQAFVDNYNGCQRDSLGDVLISRRHPYQSYVEENEEGVVTKLLVEPQSTSTVHISKLPFKTLEELAGRGLAVVVSSYGEGNTIAAGKILGDILACCKLAFDDQKRTLKDAGFGQETARPQRYRQPHPHQPLPRNTEPIYDPHNPPSGPEY